jgi:glutamine amidotransferase
MACPLFKDIPNNAYMYFCHSYYVVPQDKKVIAAKTRYDINFTSVIYDKNIFGVQFHPEKSQKLGLRILKNFVEL